jgi:anti-sigma-K factor RskA
MTCQDFEELLGAYVLDALTPEERKEAEKHLEQCSECNQKLQELQSVVNLLPLTVPDVEPVVDLKARFFSQLERDAAVAGQPLRYPAPANITRRSRRSRKSRWGIALLTAAAVLLLALSGSLIAWNLSLQRQIAITAQDTVHTISYQIQGTEAPGAINGELTCYAKQNFCTLVMHGLPQLEDNQIYQGWLLQGKQPTSVGLLNIQNGVATLIFQGTTAGFNTAAVSLEPGPSASKDAPRGKVVAAGSL